MRALLDVLSRVEGYSPNVLGLLFMMVGEEERALAWLERGYEQRDPLMTNLKAHPAFDPIRSDPRFDDLLRRIGFPED